MAAALLQAGRKTVVLGTRRSPLALVQTRQVQEMLQKACPDIKFELKEMATTGDKILDVPLAQIGDKGLFTKELELALLRNEIDLAVHSLKDVPTHLPVGLVLGAITEREDPHDALVLHAKHAGRTLESLPAGSMIGTSSLRRVAQLKRAHPHLVFKDVRGNLNTRLRKLDDGEYDALVLAVAGLTRLGVTARISQRIPYDVCLHAVGQGAYGIECRADDAPLLQFLHSTIHHVATAQMCNAERAFLRELEGGCQVPVAVSTSIADNVVTLRGAVLALDGSVQVAGEEKGPVTHATEIGKRLALHLKQNGAGEILAAIEKGARTTKT